MNKVSSIFRQELTGGANDAMNDFKEVIISSDKMVMMYTERGWCPPTDIYETDNAVVVKCELAGINPKEIHLTASEEKLIISGARHEAPIKTKRTYHQMEINYGKFERTINVHDIILPGEATAVYKDGFLEITLPKAKAKKPKTASSPIEIKFED